MTMTEEDRETDRRVRRARYGAQRQGYRVQRRGDLFDLIDPWTSTIVAEGLDLDAAEAWLAE